MSPTLTEIRRQHHRRSRYRPGAFNIGHGRDAVPPPEHDSVDRPSGAGVTVSRSERRVDARKLVAPSRTLEICTPREVDRFIRFVRRRRQEMTERDRYLNRMGLAIAGGSPASTAGVRQGVASQPATMAAQMVPFCQASKRGGEPGPSWEVTPGASTTLLGPAPLPAQGYMRMIEVFVKTVHETEEEGGATVAKEDFPTNLLQLVRLQDTNGNQLDDLPGFALGQDNIFGGYAGRSDFRNDFDFSKTAKKPTFQLYITRELAPNGFGALANMSASQAFKLTLRIASESEIFKEKAKAASLKVGIETFLHFWQLPEEHDMLGRQQATAPPFHGTTQYRWYSPGNSVVQNFNLSITQTGNEIRNIILVGRNESSVRKNAMWPEPLQLRWDTELLIILSQPALRKIASELVVSYAGATETPVEGVLPLPFNFGEGRFVGGASPSSWLPTVTSTRLQITGTQPASEPGKVDVFVNDVSVAETNPELRPVVPGTGGFNPPVAPNLPGAQ